MRILGVLCIAVGLALIIGLRFIGPPGTRGHAAWSTYNKSQAVLAGGVAIVLGIFLLLGGGD